jgi:hypothetical protein
MGWKLLAGFVIVLVLLAGALAFYGVTASPPTHSVEQVLPDSKFPK